MDENELYAAFGIKPEAGEDGRAGGAPDAVDLGGGGQGAAQGAQSREAGAAEDGGTPSDGAGGSAAGEGAAPAEDGGRPGETGLEARRAQDAAQLERQAQKRAAQEAVDRAYAQAYAGKVNPYTGKPIDSKAEYDQYQAAFQADQQRQRMEEMRAAGIAPEVIASIVDQHPVIQQAQRVIQEAEAERARARETQAKSWYESQLREINALDPEAKVGKLEDLAAKKPEDAGHGGRGRLPGRGLQGPEL